MNRKRKAPSALHRAPPIVIRDKNVAAPYFPNNPSAAASAKGLLGNLAPAFLRTLAKLPGWIEGEHLQTPGAVFFVSGKDLPARDAATLIDLVHHDPPSLVW
jgi:hypothetical protein